jgi:hypothetical protein
MQKRMRTEERDGNHKIEKERKTLIDYCLSYDIWMDG